MARAGKFANKFCLVPDFAQETDVLRHGN